MSRVGRSPISVPSNVTVKVDKGNSVTVTGPRGTLTQQLSVDMTIDQQNGRCPAVSSRRDAL